MPFLLQTGSRLVFCCFFCFFSVLFFFPFWIQQCSIRFCVHTVTPNRRLFGFHATHTPPLFPVCDFQALLILFFLTQHSWFPILCCKYKSTICTASVFFFHFDLLKVSKSILWKTSGEVAAMFLLFFPKTFNVLIRKSVKRHLQCTAGRLALRGSDATCQGSCRLSDGLMESDIPERPGGGTTISLYAQTRQTFL